MKICWSNNHIEPFDLGDNIWFIHSNKELGLILTNANNHE
jgi:hypothetical protein